MFIHSLHVQLFLPFMLYSPNTPNLFNKTNSLHTVHHVHMQLYFSEQITVMLLKILG